MQSPQNATTSTALLVIDMQHEFLSLAPKIRPHIEMLVHQFRGRGLPVVFTRHGHSRAELAGETVNQLVRRWGVDGSIHEGSKAWELLPEIEALRERYSIPVSPKNSYDAFLGTGDGLEEMLRRGGGGDGGGGSGGGPPVGRVVIVGVMTDACCATTARSAFNRGFETWFVRDACWTDSEKQHEDALNAFEGPYGEVVTVKQVSENLGLS